MWELLKVLILSGFLFQAIGSDSLSLNPGATLFNDVKSVVHNTKTRLVTVSLAEGRKCAKPTFLARLSGASLHLLEVVQRHTTTDTVVFGYTSRQDVGIYFLEVLTMYCETFQPDSFSNMCLVPPFDGRNVLTLPYSFNISSVQPNKPLLPRWVLQKNATSALLPTRYQKQCGGSFCPSQESDIARHNLYHWTDKLPYEHLLQKTVEWGLSNLTSRTSVESITICMVGDSHAGSIARHGNSLNLSRVNFELVPNRYPQLFEASLLENCTYAVLGYGQWPLSLWMGGNPYNGSRFELEIRRVLRDVVSSPALRTQVFMRSMNVNALGFRHTRCPAYDFRNPPVVMMYNDILSRLCAEHNVPFIDMRPVQTPLWDIALDWSHPHGRVFTAEAEHIVHSVLTYSHAHHRAPVLAHNFSAHVRPEWKPSPIKFSDSSTLYVMQGGRLRAFPDAQTRYRMGYNDKVQTEVMDASRKANFQFGPDLLLV